MGTVRTSILACGGTRGDSPRSASCSSRATSTSSSHPTRGIRSREVRGLGIIASPASSSLTGGVGRLLRRLLTGQPTRAGSSSGGLFAISEPSSTRPEGRPRSGHISRGLPLRAIRRGLVSIIVGITGPAIGGGDVFTSLVTLLWPSL